MVEMRPYPAYKDSRVPWLGQVPEHWNVLPNRALFAEVKERDHADEEMLSVTITQGVIRQQTLLAGTSKKDSSNLDRTAYKLVRPGDIAYNKMRAWQGAVGVSQYRGIVSPAYVVVRPRGDHNPRYFHYLLRTPAFAKEAERWSYGITSDQWSLRPEHFKMIYSCLPPGDEQSAIVRFLDYADRRIRLYIRGKQRLIALLNEQKQAIIDHAVTRGLDPNAPLKPSGVEWLGDVPEHWDIVRIKNLVRLQSGDGITSADISDTGPYPVYGGNGVRGLTSTYTHEGEFILIGRQGALCGNIHHAKGRFWASEHALVAQPCRSFNVVWFGEVLLTMNLNQYSISAAQPGLAVERIENLRLPHPEGEEQARIAQFVEAETAGLARTIAAAQREIGLVREYRTRLIADVVTGKVDVRHLTPPAEEELPEPPEDVDSEPSDEEEATEETDAREG